MSKPRKPRPVVVDDLRAIPQRAPTSRNPHWSWRCRRNGELLLSGRMSRDEVRKRLARILLEEPAEETEAVRIETVGVMMDAWFTNDIQGQKAPRTELQYRYSARRIRSLIGDIRVDRGRWVMDELHRAMDAAGYAHNTKRLTQNTLGIAWRWAYGHDLVTTAPAPKRRMSIEKTRRVLPTLDDAYALIACTPSPWSRVLLVQLATGARVGEVCALQVGDVITEGGRLIVALGRHERARKTGERFVPITLEGAARDLRAAAAEARLAGRRELWVGPRGGRMTETAVGQRLRKLDWAEVGCEPFTTHALRYLAVQQMRHAGVKAEVAAAILGHSVAMMLNTYRLIDDGELVDAMERVRLGEAGGVRGL